MSLDTILLWSGWATLVLGVLFSLASGLGLVLVLLDYLGKRLWHRILKFYDLHEVARVVREAELEGKLTRRAPVEPPRKRRGLWKK